MRDPGAFLLNAAVVVSFGCATRPMPAASPGGASKAPAQSAAATFACGDSLPRADGAQSPGTPCNPAREYCYEASGGAAVSHGAHCRPLPKPGATCADLVAIAGAGSDCTGAPGSGLRLQFAFP